eukprot:703910-Alexandrium_andersonii.AAC.1
MPFPRDGPQRSAKHTTACQAIGAKNISGRHNTWDLAVQFCLTLHHATLAVLVNLRPATTLESVLDAQ